MKGLTWFDSLAQLLSNSVIPTGKHEHCILRDFALNLSELLRLNNQRPEHAAQTEMFSDVGMAVIPKTTRLFGHEAVGMTFAWQDVFLSDVRSAVGAPALKLIDAMPVHGVGLSASIVHNDLDVVAFLHMDQRPRHLSVERPDLRLESWRDREFHLLNVHFEFALLRMGGGDREQTTHEGQNSSE